MRVAGRKIGVVAVRWHPHSVCNCHRAEAKREVACGPRVQSGVMRDEVGSGHNWEEDAHYLVNGVVVRSKIGEASDRFGFPDMAGSQ